MIELMKNNMNMYATNIRFQRGFHKISLFRKHYINDGILDAFAYKSYLNDLFKYVPVGQIIFYKELSKLN